MSALTDPRSAVYYLSGFAACKGVNPVDFTLFCQSFFNLVGAGLFNKLNCDYDTYDQYATHIIITTPLGGGGKYRTIGRVLFNDYGYLRAEAEGYILLKNGTGYDKLLNAVPNGIKLSFPCAIGECISSKGEWAEYENGTLFLFDRVGFVLQTAVLDNLLSAFIAQSPIVANEVAGDIVAKTWPFFSDFHSGLLYSLQHENRWVVG